jgi:predicted NodU family carbamoyl transferase
MVSWEESQMNKKLSGYIAAIARGHNAGVCLLKDGKIIFSIEEERLSRQKYDGGPFAAMIEILKHTDKIDYLVVAHTQKLKGIGAHTLTDTVGPPIGMRLRDARTKENFLDTMIKHTQQKY